MDPYVGVILVSLVAAIAMALLYRRIRHPEQTATHDSHSDPGAREHPPG
jgi:hypothetical protein